MRYNAAVEIIHFSDLAEPSLGQEIAGIKAAQGITFLDRCAGYQIALPRGVEQLAGRH